MVIEGTAAWAAVVRIAGSEIDVILNTNRTQTFEPDVFANLGIDPLSQPLLLVKSTNHFYAGFAPIASEIIYVAAGAAYPNKPRDELPQAHAQDLAQSGRSVCVVYLAPQAQRGEGRKLPDLPSSLISD